MYKRRKTNYNQKENRNEKTKVSLSYSALHCMQQLWPPPKDLCYFCIHLSLAALFPATSFIRVGNVEACIAQCGVSMSVCACVCVHYPPFASRVNHMPFCSLLHKMDDFFCQN